MEKVNSYLLILDQVVSQFLPRILLTLTGVRNVIQ